MKKKILSLVLTGVVALSIGLLGCGNSNNNTAAVQPDKQEVKKIVIGASPVPHVDILEKVKPILEEEGYELEIQEFNDYVIPNTALEDGDLDANFFQHIPYLEQFNKEKGTHLVDVVKVHLEPMGVYSNKIKSLDELKDGDEVSIPNDATNGSRALRLLEENGLIKLKNVELVSTLDIIENPKNLDIKELDAPQLPRTLDDVAISVINSNYAMDAGYNPVNDSLAIESKDVPYANVIVVREEDKDAEFVKALVKAVSSDEIKQFIEEEYQGQIIPSF